MPDLRRVFSKGVPQTLGCTQKIASAVTEWARFAHLYDEKVNKISQSQLSAVFWESICSMITYGDELWTRNAPNSTRPGAGYRGPLEPIDIVLPCLGVMGDYNWTWHSL